MNLIFDVCGSFEATELLRVYMTSMAVIETFFILKSSELEDLNHRLLKSEIVTWYHNKAQFMQL